MFGTKNINIFGQILSKSLFLPANLKLEGGINLRLAQVEDGLYVKYTLVVAILYYGQDTLERQLRQR